MPAPYNIPTHRLGACSAGSSSTLYREPPPPYTVVDKGPIRDTASHIPQLESRGCNRSSVPAAASNGACTIRANPSNPAAEDDERILNRVLQARPSPVPPTASERKEAEKLRYFLLYLLVIDYSVDTLTTVTRGVLKQYLDLARHLFDYREYSSEATATERSLLASYFRASLFVPAYLFSLPGDLVVARLLDFRRYVDEMGGVFKSSIHSILRDKGERGLERKFDADIDILIPGFVPPYDPLRPVLLDRAHTVRGRYFKDSTRLSQVDDPINILRQLPQRAIPSAYLREYTEARNEGQRTRAQAVQDGRLRRLVEECLKRLWDRAKSAESESNERARQWLHQPSAAAECDYLEAPK